MPSTFETMQRLRPDLGDADHQLWRDFIEARCGLSFGETQRRYLCQRLWDRMTHLGLDDYGAYFAKVSAHPGGESEWSDLLETLVNRESRFFRHQPSYDALANDLFPDLSAAKRRLGSNRLSLWSAGCSHGQEPYSLAMTLLEHLDLSRWQATVCATDISRRALDKAVAAKYKPHELRGLPEAMREKYLDCHGTDGDYYFVMQRRVRDLVRFERRNLCDRSGFSGPLHDVIFCQNLLIYLREPARAELVSNLCASLLPGGYLVLGPAEVIGLKVAGCALRSIKDSLIYQRLSG